MQDRQFGQWLTSLLSVVHQSAYSAGQTDNQRRLNNNEYKLGKERVAYEEKVNEMERGFLDKIFLNQQMTVAQRDKAYKEIAVYVGVTVVTVGIIVFSGVLNSEKKRKKKGGSK